jgi:Secretion system C-terminal sorting domain
MAKFFTFLFVCYSFLLFGITPEGHVPTTALGYIPASSNPLPTPAPHAYTVSPNMLQTQALIGAPQSTILASAGASIFVNFKYDTGGKFIRVVYTTDGSVPNKTGNGVSVDAVFSSYVDNGPDMGATAGDRTWVATIPSQPDGTVVKYVAYASDGVLADSWGKVGPNGIQYPGVEGETPFEYTVAAALPVEVTKFTAFSNNNKITINWQTASEKDNARFDIERSLDGQTFATIGTQKGNGNSQILNNYTFADKTAVNGMNYYRLKDVAFDGTSGYSQVIAVQFGTKKHLNTYPNPATNTLTLEYSAEKESTVNIQVVDLFGKVQVSTFENLIEGNNILPLDISLLPAGAYVVKIGETVVRFEKN